MGAMSRWQSHRWLLEDVVLEGEVSTVEIEKTALKISKNDSVERWKHGGYTTELYADDAEGYYLNVSTQAPCWFVLWRMEEEAAFAEEPIAIPQIVTLSYHDAGRWLDAQETVEQVPAPPEIVEWLHAFVDQYHVQELKRRKRPESFKSLTDRFGNPASVSTEKKFGGGGGGSGGAGGGTGNANGNAKGGAR